MSFVPTDTCANAVKTQERERLISTLAEGRRAQRNCKRNKNPDCSLVKRRIRALILAAQEVRKCEN